MLKKMVLIFVGLTVFSYGNQDLQTYQKLESPQELFYPNFTDNPAFNESMRKSIYPLLLPLDHPMKRVLDKIFSSARVADSDESLRAAGFTIAFSQKRTLIRVIKHPDLPGYLVKLFPNSERNLLSSGCGHLRQRCVVAKEIRELITRKNLIHFEVPDKWLYPLPHDPTGRKTQPVVLLVTDMNIVSWAESKRTWRKCADRSVFDELYQILGRGQGSTYLPGNIPPTRRGTFAFVDTEYGQRQLRYSRFYQYISRSMRAYWRSVVVSHPPLD